MRFPVLFLKQGARSKEQGARRSELRTSRVPLPASRFLLLLLLLPTAVWAANTIYVAPTGSDTHTCAEATSRATPRRTLNGGLACVEPGGTLESADGTYDELLVGQEGSSRDCPPALAQVQQPCAPVPSGLSPAQPTRVVGGRATVLSPRGREFPGGGGIFTGFAASRYLHFEALRFVQDSAPGSGAGVVFGPGSYGTLTRSEVAGGGVKSSSGSHHLTITLNEVHHVGGTCDTFVQRSPPCPHGMYVMATDSLVAHNVVHHNSNYGIQVSAEQGGIARVQVVGNVVLYNPGVGIRIQGDSNTAVANVLVGNGRGVTHAGTQLVIAHNTIVGYDAREPDPMGIFGSGATTIANNLLYGFPGSFHLIATEQFTPPSSAVAHHNMSDTGGNTAVTLVAPAATVFAGYATQDYSLAAGSPARGAGVPVAGVSRDVRGHAYPTPPDLGAYAASGSAPPIPPRPPEPPAGGTQVTCQGLLGRDAGALVLLCAPQTR